MFNLNEFITKLANELEIKDIDFKTASKYYLANLKPLVRPSTYKFKQGHIKNIISYLDEHKIENCSQLNNDFFNEYVLYFQTRNVKNVTINKRIMIIKQILDHANNISLINFNYLKETKKLKEVQPKKNILTISEIIKLQQYAYSLTHDPVELRNQLIILLLITTGIRRTELSLLKKKNINFNDNSIFLDHTKTGETRYIYFDQYIKQLMKKIITTNDSEYIIVESRNNKEPFNADNITKLLTKIKRKLGFSSLSPHILRHTFATHLLKNGANIESVRILMGHANIKTTQIYLHLDENTVRNDFYKYKIKN